MESFASSDRIQPVKIFDKIVQSGNIGEWSEISWTVFDDSAGFENAGKFFVGYAQYRIAFIVFKIDVKTGIMLFDERVF